MTDPRFKGSMIILAESCFNSSTTIVASNDDILNFEMLNSVLDNSKNIDIWWWGNVGNVPVNEYFSRFQPHYFVCWDTGVCTTYPKQSGTIQSVQLFEIVRFTVYFFYCPFFVILHNAIEKIQRLRFVFTELKLCSWW